jgi:hypothetical protein
MVAIDTRNAVFASQDGGRHWKPVQPQWPGRAVTAVLVNFPIMNEARNAVNDALVAPVPQTSTSAPVANNLPRFTAAGRPALAGSLTGTVTDRSGAVIRGASVTIRDPATHATRTVTTDSAGRYQIEGLTPGAEQSEVQVEVQARGFQKQTLASVAIRTDSANVANVSLAVGAASQSVEVSSAGPAIETTPTPLPDQNSSGTSKKELAPSGASLPAPALFEITTDNGDRWTSPDGVTWKQR